MAERPTFKVKVKDKGVFFGGKEVCGVGVCVCQEAANVFVSPGCSNGLTPDRYGPNYPIWRSVRGDWQRNHSFQFALKP